MSFDHLEKNDEFLRAFDLFERSSRNIFLTGRAGTGKSTLLQYFRSSTSKNTAVLAPTGVAAVNIKGQTIHSFFNFRPDITVETVGNIKLRRGQKDIYQNLDTLIIDEVSMVRADLLDCMDAFLRMHRRQHSKPFGGVQMILIGDLYQLPPVVMSHERDIFTSVYPGPYFFNAKCFAGIDIEFMELATIYRQKEDRFIRLLNAVRDNNLVPEDLALLNRNVKPSFEPPAEDFYVHLTTTNDLADRTNQARLAALKGRVYEYGGILDGEFESRNLPTQEALKLKVNAQVMLLNNDPMGRWVNGSIGHITDIVHSSGHDVIRVRLSDGNSVDLEPFTWEMYRFSFDKESGRIDSEVVGVFTQFPLRLAWAVTIHKAQGKTFSKVVIDIGYGAFAHGQVYVALSRCISLEGIVLRKPILRQHILMDDRIRVFLFNLKKAARIPQIVLE
jgi:ATP-dependent exoDNAse (exonuclease V) alpha subunit